MSVKHLHYDKKSPILHLTNSILILKVNSWPFSGNSERAWGQTHTHTKTDTQTNTRTMFPAE